MLVFPSCLFLKMAEPQNDVIFKPQDRLDSLPLIWASPSLLWSYSITTPKRALPCSKSAGAGLTARVRESS